MNEATAPQDGHVLVVEDDESLCELLVEELCDAEFTVANAHTAEEALQYLDDTTPDVIVSDLRLPGASGMELLQNVRARHVPPAFIVITAFGSIPQAVSALKKGADDFLTKPLNLDHFVLTVSRSLENRRLRQRVRQFEQLLGSDHFHGIIGRSRDMQVLFDQIRQIARASGPVLIQGESGVGKELVARAVHAESPRADEEFLAVNCAGVPRELLESEFFGHVEGAFTGAQGAREGLFVEADGSTLLLDEVTEMPGALQAKLLRVLEEEAVRPVGSNRAQSVDVRVLASTNRNLEEAVEDGAFREDLYYRLETFQFEVPPLRDRGDDLDLLTTYFLNRFADKMDKQIEGIAPDAMQQLKTYAFPGNVRELKNAIERAVTFCREGEVQSEHLPARIRKGASADRGETARIDLQHLLGDPDALPPLREVEHAYIQHVLERVDGNKRRAASILDIGRRTLYRRLEEADSSQEVVPDES